MKKILFHQNEDLLFSERSKNYLEELFKLKILRLHEFINNKDYRILKKRSLKIPTDATYNIANQLFDLYTLVNLSIINTETYSLRKEELIYKI
jgi:hypothetical protein